MPAAATIRDLLSIGAKRLRTQGSETADLDAALLLGHLLHLSRAALYARLHDPLPADIDREFFSLIAARERQVPIAYLTGTKEFMGLDFAVNAATLVPRPETELLVEWAVRWLRHHPGASVIDVGTGSGAIAVSLAHAVLTIRVIASDISRGALRVARANAHRHGVLARTDYVCGALLAWFGARADLIVANLPYLTDVQAASPEIAAEPSSALVGGAEDGFALYRALLPQVATHLHPGGAFAFEIDPAQEQVARKACAASFPGAAIVVHADLAGHARCVTVETGV